MADIAASTKLGQGYGPVIPGLGVKCVCVSFATTATGDVLIFDTSNVGQENAIRKITFAVVIAASGAPLGTNVITSNQITVGDLGAAGAGGATNVVALVCGIGG